MQGKKLGLVLVGIRLREFGVASFESFDEELFVLLCDFSCVGYKRKSCNGSHGGNGFGVAA
jgi:hypothetical protein